jgi:hypothetical protein
MKTYRPLRAGLFVYECFRLFFLVAVFTVLRPGEGLFPWLVYAAPGALFPLMTLFLWLNISRYSAYLPLYAAGKWLSFFTAALWSVSFRQNIITAALAGNAMLFIMPGIVGILLFGDLLSAAAGLIVLKKAGQESE